MPRSPTGEYTLPLPPVISGATIEADWANTTLNDMSVTLTDSLSRTAQGNMSNPLKLVDGAKTAPGLSFVNEANTGFYRPSAGDLYVSVLGVDYMRWTDDNGVQFSVDGTNWLDVADKAEVLENEVNIDINAADIGALDDRVTAIETADPFVAQSLQVAGEVNQISIAIAGTSGNLTADTTTGNRFVLTNNGAINLTITKPVSVRDIGPNYTIEGNIIVSNGATPGAVTIVGAPAGTVLGQNNAVADAYSMLSYVMHNRNGTYTEMYIWTAVTS